MTTLPSFVELMASLGLDNTLDRGSDPSCPRSLRPPSSVAPTPNPPRSLSGPASFQTAPSIVMSDHDAPYLKNSDLEESCFIRGQYVRRFAPYSPRISHVRNRSVPAPFNDGLEGTGLGRPVSTSPRLAATAVRSRPSNLDLKEKSRRRASTLHAETIAGTPISTFVRRKTPCASPTSPDFPHRSVRTPPADPSAPVSLPSIPPLPPMPYSYSPTSSDHPATSRSDSVSPRPLEWHRPGAHLASVLFRKL
ncbi:hypothetical protein GLOTRDRAFT_136431, partial [Gloeophyllum trabeum ATCC 11539]